MDYSIYFMVFLGVYYTLLDIGELGAEGLMLTLFEKAEFLETDHGESGLNSIYGVFADGHATV